MSQNNFLLIPLTLQGHYCKLVPLSNDHHDSLIEAVTDGQLWKLWYTFVPHPDNMKKEITNRLQQQENGSMLPFTVIDNETNKPIGMTTYLNIDTINHRVEIGGTWYSKSKQGTVMNTECKRLLLTQAFEEFNCHAVEFRTHAFNQQSRRSIERLGAKLDGILRNHMVMPNGTLRDTYVYSIIASKTRFC